VGTSCFTIHVPAARAQPGTPHYHQIKKIAIGGEGGWDYLAMDSGAHRLYVTRGTHVVVVDTDSDKVVGEIRNTPGVHGVALAPKLNLGFTSNGRENTVTQFDLRTLKEIRRISVGQNPDAILYHEATGRVFTFNGGSSNATAIDVKTGKVVGTIPLGGKPEFAVDDDKGMIYCNIEDKSEIVKLDARSLGVKGHWSIAPVEEPSGLAIDRVHHRLFSVGGNRKMAIVDTGAGKLVTTTAIGAGPDACVFDAGNQMVFSSNGEDGTLNIIHEVTPNSFKAIATAKTQTGARTMILDPKTHRIYLMTAAFKADSPGGGRRPTAEPNSGVILVYGP